MSLGLWDGLKETPKLWKSKSHWVLLSCFAFFLTLPLTLGLSVYLKTDANVLVVILWVIWTYNWVKYAFWRE
ncbi:hypothetical protein EHS15_03070 [Leptospira idonii]|uniref:Uncharacterized protein n=1 Tax=Leptospira idonii TaxID=1193500 RepID=A0A4V3JYC5_9LEPT|nr:hypothetical protein EHS15_03070 [Leptospira idonii]